VQTFLGIDGGGSKTRALLIDSQGQAIFRATAGPSNLNAYDESTVLASLQEAIAPCVEAAGSAPSAVCFGLAGAAAPSIKKKLHPLIESLRLPSWQLVSDAEVALEAAFSGAPGILLIAGTGSVCLGKNSAGVLHKTGGWGWLADDYGSAGWIGQQALAAALQQYDGRRGESALRDAIFADLEIESEDAINPTLYHPTLSRSCLARLTTPVMRLVNEQDPVACAIYTAALSKLEDLVRATARKMKGPASRVALTGGLFEHHPEFRKDLGARLSGFSIEITKQQPVEGAAALARKSTF